MEKFLTIFAWIMAVPTTLFVLWCGLLFVMFFVAAFCGVKNMKLTIPTQALIPIAIAAACWAWILSR